MNEERMTLKELLWVYRRIILGYVMIIGGIWTLFGCILMISYVPSESMESTLFPGDIVISTRFNVSEEEINRYDILNFKAPDAPDEIYVKRVIGLPGETVVVKDGEVYVDGEIIDNSYINGLQTRRGDGTYVVPEGCYFVLGDNRNHSNDSRFWMEKYVPLENIKSKAWFRIPLFSGQHMDSISLVYHTDLSDVSAKTDIPDKDTETTVIGKQEYKSRVRGSRPGGNEWKN